jgi:hypothetical protein
VRPGDEPQYKNAKDQHSVICLGQQERISPGCLLKPNRSKEDEQLNNAAIASLKKEGLAPKKKKQNCKSQADNDTDDTDSEPFD